MSSVSVAEAAGSPIDKFGRLWPRLTLPDYGVLESKYRTNRKDAAKATLGDMGEELPVTRRAEILMTVTGQPVTLDMVDQWLASHPGAIEALRLSLARGGVAARADQDREISLIPNMDHACFLARMLAGFIIEVPPKKKAEGAAPEGEVVGSVDPS